jgi:uncharacterized protein (TIGR02466 family)
MATTEIYPLFSTPVLTLDSDAPKFQSVINYCESVLEYRSNAGNNFTSLNTEVLLLNEFSEINRMCVEAVNHYATNVSMMDLSTIELYITQSWVNKNPKDSIHHEHYHANSLFSGVFYLQTAENDHISFNSGRKPVFAFPETDRNLWNSNKYHVPVKDNRIIIFPSNSIHNVGPHGSSWNRLSLAFNVFMRGKLGAKENLTYIEI